MVTADKGWRNPPLESHMLYSSAGKAAFFSRFNSEVILRNVIHRSLDLLFWPHVRELEEVWMQMVTHSSREIKLSTPDLAEWIVGQTIGKFEAQGVNETTFPTMSQSRYSTLALSYTVVSANGSVVVASAYRLDPTAALNYNCA